MFMVEIIAVEFMFGEYLVTHCPYLFEISKDVELSVCVSSHFLLLCVYYSLSLSHKFSGLPVNVMKCRSLRSELSILPV